MYKEIIALLKCPNCNKPLHLVDSVLEAGEIVEGKLKCYCESIGQKSELNLLPYEGEWFSIGNIYSKN